MKFPSWRRYAIKPLTLRLTPAALGTFATVLAFLSLAGGAIGYAVGAHHTTTAAKPVTPAVAVAPAVARDQQIQVMNQRIAELQARMMRLDALGQHLAESANLKSGEFNFDPKGPSGGPLVQDLSVMGSHPDIRDRLQVLSSEIERRENQLQALDSVLAGKRLQDNRQYLGNTGRSTGTHLHYEVLQNNRQIDPATFVHLALRK